MSKHTPGPWSWEFNPVSEDGLVIVEEHKQTYEWRFIATVHEGEERGDITSTEMKANARLIAAAPELLEAARLTVLMFERSQVSGNFQGDDEHEAWGKLKAAISKVEDRA